MRIHLLLLGFVLSTVILSGSMAFAARHYLLSTNNSVVTGTTNEQNQNLSLRIKLPDIAYIETKSVVLPNAFLRRSFVPPELPQINPAIITEQLTRPLGSILRFGQNIPSLTALPLIWWGDLWAQEDNIAEIIAQIEPEAGEPKETAETKPQEFRFEIEDPSLTVEAVLVPQKSTVLSSSRDGKIKAINFENGDMFRRGDVLVEYHCADVKADLAARESVETLSRQKVLRGGKLLKLEIISNIESLTLETEQKRAEAEKQALQQRLDSCVIRAEYDGRVTNRLANPGEYTRTDRVLMEVASLDALEVEFLLPSRWLRWVNTSAPIEVEIQETGQNYKAIVQQIHGEVDPVSQSIQMNARLVSYNDPLLPGMSGQAVLNVEEIRKAGIAGFLETGPERRTQ